MKKVTVPVAIIYLIVSLIVVSLAVNVIFGVKYYGKWVAGKYGEKCYLKGFENKNIKYLIEFDNLDQCQDYIK